MDSESRIEIIVDDRESSVVLLDALSRQAGVEFRFERLKVGDYLVDGGLLFERKTLPDLIESIKDGRLFSQGLRLANAPQRGALILEGTAHDLAGRGMKREAIQGALVTVTLFFGIPLLRSMNPQESASLMVLCARQGRAIATGALARKGRRPRGKSRVQGRILQGLPGIGPQRAGRLLERFGTIEAIMNAPASELATVKGIGTETARSIRWAVQEPGGPWSARTKTHAPWII